jgi:hypothetical protein
VKTNLVDIECRRHLPRHPDGVETQGEVGRFGARGCSDSGRDPNTMSSDLKGRCGGTSGMHVDIWHIRSSLQDFEDLDISMRGNMAAKHQCSVTQRTYAKCSKRRVGYDQRCA